MRAFVATVLLAAATMALPASAQVYLDAQLGLSQHGIYCSAGQSCDTDDLGYRLGVGYGFNRYVAVEFAYTSYGKSTASGTGTGQFVIEERRVESLGLYAVGTWPLDPFSLYAKLGLVDTRARKRWSTGSFEVSTTSGYLMGGLGGSYCLTPNWKLTLEWSRGRVDLGSERPNFDLYAVGAQYRF